MTRTIRPWQIFEKLGANDRDVHYRIPTEPGVVSGTISSLDTLIMIAVIRIFKAETLLEFGTGLGYNAYHLSENTDIDITTVDKDDRATELTHEYRIQRVISDVADYIPAKTFDMIFYDVNIPGLTERCTETALACGPRIMAWHDYGHPMVPHVKQYLDSLPLDIIHVEDSLMAFWFRDGFSCKERAA
jgi:tRNA A58 N-methylase Trm61